MKDLTSKWNHYFLRYCVGTVVGAVIVRMLASQLFKEDDSLIKNLSPNSAAALITLAGLGFAFCYIASAPGTVIHVARSLFYQGKTENVSISSLQKYFVRPIVFIIPFCVFALIVIALRFGYMSAEENRETEIGFSVGYFVFCVQIVLLVYVFSHFGHVQMFYRDLTSMRSLLYTAQNVHHYVKSYRDLREHGNAFEIILMELGLAAALIMFKCIFIVILALWIFPAALCWVVGTRLEFHIPIEWEAVKLLAHRIWETEGKPTGRELAHWLEAERQVRGTHNK